MYMHDLIEQLKACGYGCHVIELCIACIFFADDIVLLSPCHCGLQELLNICVAYCTKFCLDFNVNKSKVMIVGNDRADLTLFCPLLLGNSPLEFISEYKYLGVVLSADKGLCFSATTTIRSFYRAANSVLHSRVKPDQRVLMRLLYSNCIPIITYGCTVKEYSATD